MRALRAWTSRPAFGQLFLAILSFLTLSELILGLAVYARLRRDLESDLGRRLVHVVRLLATSIPAEVVVQFREGDEDLRAYEMMRAGLARQVEAAGVERAYVVDRDLKTVLDSRSGGTLGSTRYGLMVNRAEVSSVREGHATPTRLYRGEDGNLRLSALAPLATGRGEVVALVGVDAAPEFFASLAALRRRMILLGAITLALAALGTLLFLRQTERRLGRLRQAVSRATRGDFAARTEIPGRDPIGALGRDLDGLIASMVGTRDYYEAVLGGLEVGLLTTDAGGDILGANASADRLLSPGGPVLVGRKITDVVAGEEALADFIRSAAAEGARPASAELPIRGGLASGGLVVAANASCLRRGDDPPGLIVSLLDVTPLRALERRARANERLAALGRMAGGLLHELRNPLTSMVLYLDLLRPLERSGEGGEILERAISEGQRLAAFLEDFQVFAALRPLRLERAVVCEVIAAAAGALDWPENVTWRCEDRGAAAARVDRRLLEHAVRNVLQNAVEALRPTGGHVAVRVEHEGGDVEIAISDDGPGIPEELIERILDPMFTTKTQGTGMGLSIVQRVVEAHGGTLTVKSGRGRGATFTLRFPAGEGD